MWEWPNVWIKLHLDCVYIMCLVTSYGLKCFQISLAYKSCVCSYFFSLYRVSLVALGSDPQYGDSSPSNVLKLCTPVAEDRQAMTSRPSGPLTRITLDIHVSSIANTRIAFEWSHPPDVCKLSQALCFFCCYFLLSFFFLFFFFFFSFEQSPSSCSQKGERYWLLKHHLSFVWAL